jgi:hypothetical protein
MISNAPSDVRIGHLLDVLEGFSETTEVLTAYENLGVIWGLAVTNCYRVRNACDLDTVAAIVTATRSLTPLGVD